MNLALSSRPGQLATYSYPSGAYDQNKLGLGPTMVQANDSSGEGQWVGPIPISVARPVETGLLVPNIQPATAKWSNQFDWVVCADNAAVSATRRFTMWRFDKTVTNQTAWSLQGSIICTMPSQGTQGTYTNKGHILSYELYTTGSISITNGSTALTGSSTTWSTDEMCVGSRIGFPTVAGDVTTVPVWYEIGAIGSNTSITLTQTFGETTLAAANYIIEDFRIVFALTNGVTAANGGMFMVTGLRYEDFQPGGKTISAATTVDNIKAVYWLNDGNATSNVTIQAPGGIDRADRNSWQQQFVYLLNSPVGQSQFMKSNIRASKTLTAGRDTSGSTFVCTTGLQAVTGTVSTMSSLVYCTPGAGGGPRSGNPSLFWLTTTRMYSALASSITSGSTTFQAGVMTENPPGSSTTFPLMNAFSSLAYDDLSDRFLILTTAATSFQHYYTQYREDAGQFDRIILANNRQLSQTTTDNTATLWANTGLVVATAAIRNGITYLCTHGTTAITNYIYSLPLAADWEYASGTGCRVVFPVMNTAGWAQFVASYTNMIEVLRGRTGTNLGLEPNAVRMWYRTTGISDNSGTWNLIDYTGDLSGVAAASTIQFMVEYRTLTVTCIPARVTRVAVEGTGSAMDSHFQYSELATDRATKKFGFRYSTAFGGTVPKLYFHAINAVTGDTLVTDDSVTQAGTWEHSVDGSGWSGFTAADRANETTYVRITPASIADNVNVLAWLALS